MAVSSVPQNLDDDRGTEDGRELFAVALDRDSGKILFDLKLFQVATPRSRTPLQYLCLFPLPVMNPGHVYVTFGSPGCATIDTQDGEGPLGAARLRVQSFPRRHRPVLFGDLLLMHFDGSDHQFVVALDKHTGKTVWSLQVDFQNLNPDGKPKADGDFRKAFATRSDRRRMRSW